MNFLRRFAAKTIPKTSIRITRSISEQITSLNNENGFGSIYCTRHVAGNFGTFGMQTKEEEYFYNERKQLMLQIKETLNRMKNHQIKQAQLRYQDMQMPTRKTEQYDFAPQKIPQEKQFVRTKLAQLSQDGIPERESQFPKIAKPQVGLQQSEYPEIKLPLNTFPLNKMLEVILKEPQQSVFSVDKVPHTDSRQKKLSESRLPQIETHQSEITQSRLLLSELPEIGMPQSGWPQFGLSHMNLEVTEYHIEEAAEKKDLEEVGKMEGGATEEEKGSAVKSGTKEEAEEMEEEGAEEAVKTEEDAETEREEEEVDEREEDEDVIKEEPKTGRKK